MANKDEYPLEPVPRYEFDKACEKIACIKEDATTTHTRLETEIYNLRNEIKQDSKDYDKALWEKLRAWLSIELSNLRNALSIGKLVAVTVVVLFIGTAYQLFISIANSVGLK